MAQAAEGEFAAAAAAATAAAFVSRHIDMRVLSREQGEGVGARVRRSIGRPELRNFDPFLMLDEFKVGKPAGFPDHPHRYSTSTIPSISSFWRISSHFISLHLTSSYLTSSHFISLHLTSSHFISLHLTSSYLTPLYHHTDWGIVLSTEGSKQSPI